MPQAESGMGRHGKRAEVFPWFKIKSVRICNSRGFYLTGLTALYEIITDGTLRCERVCVHLALIGNRAHRLQVSK